MAPHVMTVTVELPPPGRHAHTYSPRAESHGEAAACVHEPSHRLPTLGELQHMIAERRAAHKAERRIA